MLLQTYIEHDAGERHGPIVSAVTPIGCGVQAARAARAIAVQRDRGEQSHADGQRDPAEGRAHVAVHELVDRARRVHLDHPADRRRVDVGELEHDAEEGQLTTQRDDERRQPQPRDQRPLNHAQEPHGQDAADDAEPPGQVDRRGDQLGDDEAADAHAVADAQVDLGEQQDERLGRAEQYVDRGLLEQVDQVLIGEEGGPLPIRRRR